MKIVIAPDSFKGTLSATDAALAIMRGALLADPTTEIELCPLADGGEGTAEILVSACGGILRSSRVTGPIGEPIRARWGLLSDGTAVIEAAEAVGLPLVPAPRDATRASSFGLGEVLRDALDAGATSMIIGLGGTATTDGGAGMLQALGAKLDGVGRPVSGGALSSIRSVRLVDMDTRLLEVEIIAATDVDNPLTGPSGAAIVYGPQKGASPEQAATLDAGLAHFAALLGDPGNLPGDGAAGGLGYALRVVAAAERVSGASLVLETVDFDARCAGADLVITGEGRLDAQSLRGKVVHGVAARARELGIPVVALCGAKGPDVEGLRELGLEACHFLEGDGTTREEAERNASPLLEALSARVLRSRASR